jgi:chromosome segregation ATPase
VQESKLADAAASHKAELSSAQSAHETELLRTREQLEQKAATDAAAQADRHTQDMARVGKALAEAEGKHSLLEERYEETEAARSAADRELKAVTADRDEKSKRVDDLDRELASAKAKLAHDAEVMDRVRKAMAIGLGLLDDKS